MPSIEVVDDQLGRVVGTLQIFDRGRKTNYRYDRVDPAGNTLQGVSGNDFPDELSDMTPDRWGRTLVQREVGNATPDEHVYLKYMADETRPGSLRFRDVDTGRYWGEDAEIPPLLRARDILAEVQAVAGDPQRRVSELIHMGSSSIGGARPKAQLRDGAGRLWVAKFGAGDDQPRTEARLMQLAGELGIDAAETRFERVANAEVVLSRRFDRTDDGGRRGMRSMRAVLTEMSSPPEAADWTDLAMATPDAEDELFRRAAFGVLVNNTDDHARNHSQLRGADGVWRLSPAYDITADPHPNTAHKISVYGASSPQAAASNLHALAGELGVDPGYARGWVDTAADTLQRNGLLVHPHLAAACLDGFPASVSPRPVVACEVCGRPLTSPESIARGAGPRCAGRR